MDSPKFRAIRGYVPKPLLPIARAGYYTLSRALRQARFKKASLADKDVFSHSGLEFDSPPPASLRYRVSGILELKDFFESGQLALENLENVLSHTDTSFDKAETVLDFGCGPARVLMWLQKKYPHLKLFGTDTDAESVKWCKEHMKGIKFAVNRPVPTTRYEDDQFDIIYVLSVLTHLDEEYQDQWLEEWKRIVKPGGLVLATVHGTVFHDTLPDELRTTLEKDGILYVKDYGMQGIFPDFYQVAYHTKDYVAKHYNEYFEVVAHLPEIMASKQDMLILRRRED